MRTITQEILKEYEHRRAVEEKLMFAEEELHLAEVALNSVAAQEGFVDVDDVAAAIDEQWPRIAAMVWPD